MNGLNPQTNVNKKLVHINILDVGIILIILMLTLFVSSSWLVEPDVSSIPLIKSIGLNITMLVLISLAFVVYLIAGLTKSLPQLKLVDAGWIFGAIIAIPIWLFYNSFLPLASSTGQLVSKVPETNVIVSFFGTTVFNFIQALWVYGFIESVILGILLLFLLGVSKVTKGIGALIPVFVIIVLFMAILHSAVALAIDSTGQLDFGTILIHQTVAFAIMGMVFIVLGMSANIAFHQVKNALALNFGLIFWIALFAFYVLITILALRQSGKVLSMKNMIPGRFGVRGD